MRKLFFILVATFVVFSCGVSQYSSVQVKNQAMSDNLQSYQYFFAIPASQLTAGTGYAVSGGYGMVFGGSSSKSVNPTDIINGYMMKKGFRRLMDMEQSIPPKTIIISYGESDRHPMGLGYAIEVTIQLIDATTNEIILTSTAAGIGETEADDIRKATLNCLKNIFGE